MIRKIILSAAVIFPFLLNAQVTMSAQLPPAGMVPKDQLWNLVLVNSKADILNVHIKMNLQDATTNQVVMSANSGDFLLGKGVKPITVKDLQPILYNYNLPDFSKAFLPMGSYLACYQLYKVSGEKEEPLSDDCVTIHVDPLSPPLLNSPIDSAEIQTSYPQFTWMPPTPINMFSSLSYDITLVEVLPGQAASEALQHNTPIFSKSNIVQPREDYPSSFSKLDTGKIYAWQVIARNGLNYAAKTDVWTFQLKKEDKAEPEIITDSYILLQSDLLGTYTIRKDFLHVKYFSFDKEHESVVVFTDEKENIIHQESRKVLQGDNYFDFSVSKKFQTGKIYQVTITDLTGKNHRLKFRISQNK